MTSLASLAEAIGQQAASAWRAAPDALEKAFLEPDSICSIQSLACALGVCIAYVWIRRRGRLSSLKLLLKTLFPGQLLRSPSFRVDMGFFLFNTFAFIALFGSLIVSATFFSHLTQDALTRWIGHRAPLGLSPLSLKVITTVEFFLTFEFAYWFDHYLNHKVPFFWEFHKVHHSSESLSPATNFRLHPIDLLKYYNVTAIIAGVCNGLTSYGLVGSTRVGFLCSFLPIIAPWYLFQHLQHSRIWISFTGVWGRLFISPAHHQIHHSTDPADFDCNLGQVLAIWDWMFGTLRIPTREPRTLRYGVEGVVRPQTLYGCLAAPFGRAVGVLRDGFVHLGQATRIARQKRQGPVTGT